MVRERPPSQLTRVLAGLGIAPSSWYLPAVPLFERRRPGPPPKTIDPEVEKTLLTMATENPWYGYKWIAVMCRRLPRR